MARETKRIFKESLAPKLPTKKVVVKESKKLTEGEYLEGCDSCIVIYPDEVTSAAWSDYCENVGAPLDASRLIIYFNSMNADYETEDEEEEEMDESKEKGHMKFKATKMPIRK